MLIYDKGRQQRNAGAQQLSVKDREASRKSFPENLVRKNSASLPEVSEMQVVRHYTKLSRKNFSIDTHFIHWEHAP